MALVWVQADSGRALIRADHITGIRVVDGAVCVLVWGVDRDFGLPAVAHGDFKTDSDALAAVTGLARAIVEATGCESGSCLVRADKTEPELRWIIETL